VPFTPGSSAIFVPIRIVFSVALPSAGLFKHGAAYLNTPADQVPQNPYYAAEPEDGQG